jgi:hypothetical protein
MTSEFQLKHTFLSIHYYNKMEQGPRILQHSNLKTPHTTMLQAVTWHENVLRVNYSKHLEDYTIGPTSFLFLLPAT